MSRWKLMKQAYRSMEKTIGHGCGKTSSYVVYQGTSRGKAAIYNEFLKGFPKTILVTDRHSSYFCIPMFLNTEFIFVYTCFIFLILSAGCRIPCVFYELQQVEMIFCNCFFDLLDFWHKLMSFLSKDSQEEILLFLCFRIYFLFKKLFF